MQNRSHVDSLMTAIVHALTLGLPETPRRSLSKLALYHFPQEFVGPSRVILIPVSVISDGEAAAVYFSGNHAYTIARPNTHFWEAVGQMTMAGASFSSVYETPKVIA